MSMNLILNTIMQEKQRIEYMIERYAEEHQRLPKGTISEKKSGDKTYYYLKYRDGKRVVSQYINKETIDEVKEKVEKRKHIEAMMKSLQDELAIAKRVLEAEL